MLVRSCRFFITFSFVCLIAVTALAQGENADFTARDAAWNRALVQKFGTEKLTSAEDDIAAYAVARRTYADENYEAQREMVVMLDAALVKNILSDDDKKTAQGLRDAAARGVKIYDLLRAQDNSAAAPDVERRVAAAEFTAWQADALLFKTYGGKLARRNDRIVPVDAYRDFAREMMSGPAFAKIMARDLGGFAPPDEIVPYDGRAYYAAPDALLKLDPPNAQVQKLRAWLGQPR